MPAELTVERAMQVSGTFGLPSVAGTGCHATSAEQARAAWAFARQHGMDFMPLGEGSNILPHRELSGFVCVMVNRGVGVLAESSSHVSVRVAAGENWHEFVLRCLQQGWYGLENLALIPGSVGASPVQNIGAYGVEVAEHLKSVRIINRQGELETIPARDCGFSYRDSRFKREPGEVIVSVDFELGTSADVVTDYPDLIEELAHRNTADSPSPQDVAEAVMALRRRKLPDPAEHPNVGSFFKNPMVSEQVARHLVDQYPHLKTYPVPDEHAGQVKLSAAQLIDEAGWKARPTAHVRCWPVQPLVLVNTGLASCDEVLEFAASIQADIHSRYGVQLELEPSVLS